MFPQQPQQPQQPPAPKHREVQTGGHWENVGYVREGDTNRFTQNPAQFQFEFNRDAIELDKAAFNEWDPTAEWDYRNELGVGPQGQPLPENAIGWQPNGSADYGSGFGGWWRKMTGKAKEAWATGWDEGLRVSVISGEVEAGEEASATRGVKDITAKEAEQKGSKTLAGFSGGAQALYSVFGSMIEGGLQALGSIAVTAEQVLGSTAYAIADVAKGQDINWQRNWEASRMLYSGLFDASVFSQMERLIDSGVEGRFAEQIIQSQNPWTLWTELGGEIIFDPLNAVSVMTKGLKTIKSVKAAQATFRTVENPVIRELIENADLIKQMDNSQAYSKLDELVKAQKGLPAATAHAEDIAKATGNLEELSKSYRMSSLTSSGKISHLSNETSSILMHIVNNSTPDEALDILNGMIKSVSSNADEAAEGVAAMLHFTDAPALFSSAGNDTTVLLSRMYDKYGDTWLKSIDALKDNPQELTRELLTKLDDVGQEMFPSVTKMIAAEDAVKGAKTPEALAALTDETRKLAEAAGKLPDYVKGATRLHDKAQVVVAPLNRFFAGVYMGWSPGYAFRNWMNNSLQMFIDQGAGAFIGKADDMFDEVRALHGGVLDMPGGFTPVTGEAAGVAKGTGIADIGQAIKQETKLFGQGAKGPAQIAGAMAEENAAKRIVATEYKRTFDRGLRAMMKDMAPQFKEAGFTDDFINRLPTYIYENMGDSRAIMNAIRRDSQLGVIDMFGNVDRIDPKYKDFLGSLGKWDEYNKTVLHAGSKDEAVAAARKIFDDIASVADEAYRDPKSAVTMFDQTLKFFGEGPNGLPDSRSLLLSRRVEQSDATMKIADDLTKQLDTAVSQFSAKSGIPIDVGQLKDQYGLSGLLPSSEARTVAHQKTNLVNQLYRDAKKRGADLQELWRTYAGDFFNNEPPPPDLTKDLFMDRMWTTWDRDVTTTYGKGRDLMIERLDEYAAALKNLGVDVPTKNLDELRDARQLAYEMDNALVGPKGEMWLMDEAEIAKPYGTRTSEISAVAKKYGIATATERGTPRDRALLNIISKYADVDYRSLEEIPPEVAEAAFRIRAGLAPGIETVEETVTVAGKFSETGSPFSYMRASNQQLAPEYFEEVFGGKFNIDKAKVPPGFIAAKGGGLGLDDMGVRLAEGGFITADQAQDTNYVAQFLRDAVGAGGETTYARQVKVLPTELKQALGGGTAATGEVKQAGELRDVTRPYYDDAGNLVEPKGRRILPPPDPNGPVSLGRSVYEQMHEVKNIRKWVMDDIAKNYGRKLAVDPVNEKALRNLENALSSRIAENRLISSRVAKEARDFSLLNYGEKSYWDVALAYIYPYHFWYKGTYKNWFNRVFTNPSVLAHYQRYKENLGNVHAGMPDWWKYNINTNDLPGVNMENPMYFNLEATLWPLNGITGTDFNDPVKRVNWWTNTLDFANKFGPSIWSPINMITGLSLYAMGQKDAGERWMGRLIPQSATIKAAGSLLGISNLETDPFVAFLQDGLDPYERRRVQRALAEMEQDVMSNKLPYTREQIQDAAYAQEGPIWDEAVKRAVYGRSKSQLTSFFAGVGFKGRTAEDMEIDNFYTDYNRMWAMRPNLKQEEWRQAMNQMQQKYPFMDTVLLSRRDGVERDAGLAYLVLNRIPPGQTTDIARSVGIDPKLMDKFYADKGQIDGWTPADRMKFMAGVMSIAAVLEIPSDMTRNEWVQAKNAYTTLTTEAKGKFGENILDVVDGYYAAKTKGPDAATGYLDDHPEVSDYMNWKAERVMGSPLLSSYYGGASMIEGYYRSQMYADIEKQLGPNIFDVMTEYNDLKTYATPQEYKAFYNQHKAEISQYYNLKDEWSAIINQNVAEISAYIPEAQGATIRPDVDTTSPTQQALIGAIQPQQQMTFDQFQQVIPSHVMALVTDYYTTGDRLPESAEKQLGRLAQDLGFYDMDSLLQAIGASMYQQAQP